MSQPPFELAFSLQGHAADVRNLCAPNPSLPLLLSASRDGSAIVWGPSSKDGQWDVKLRVEGPEKRSIACVGLTRWNGEAVLLVGSSSGILSTYILPSITSSTPDQNPEPFHTLIEHRQNLCCIDTSKGGLIASGSWDKTVRIWKDFKVVVTIEKHEQAVWAVRFIGEDRLLTAAADNKIYLHSIDPNSGRSKVMQEYSGHTQPVRGLSSTTDGKGFWSCANDGLVNLYFFDQPAPIRSLSGHTSFVYSINALPDGSGAVSTGEDGTLRIWSDTGLLQTIPHPSSSIWSSAAVNSPNGSTYVVSASQDSVIRFFTRDPALAASSIEKEIWEKDVGSRQLDKSQVGDVKHSDLPGIEALGREGKKDGQVIMIKNNGAVEAYSWTTATSTWQQVGTVVDAIGQGRKQLHEGKEYDYVFDVDVAEGMPPLKLPYNVAENPWVAAQRFLGQNELPSSYTEQVVSFIEKSTAGVQLGQGDSGSYVDPYTGASRYTGASSSSSARTGGSDPFTGSSAYSSTPAAPAVPPSGVLPVRTYLSFKTMNINAAKGKISQLNDAIKSTNPDLAFSVDDEKNLSDIYELLSRPAGALPDTKAKDAGEGYNVEKFIELVTRWPEAQRFPLIDLARCLAAISPAFGKSGVAAGLLQSCDWDQPWQSSKPRETNTLLALRGLANLFLTANGRLVMSSQAGDILGRLSTGRKWEEIGARKLPLVTIALNYSVSAAQGNLNSSDANGLVDLIIFILENETADSETIYRASVALGNLLITPSMTGGLQVGSVQKARGLVIERAGTLTEKRLTDLASEIASLG